MFRLREEKVTSTNVDRVIARRSRLARFACFRTLAIATVVVVFAASHARATDEMHFDGSGREDPWSNCTMCHGSDLLGSIGSSCMDCHSAFTSPDPPATGHHFPGRDDPVGNNCGMCHGSELTGDIGPSCFDCHDQLWDGGGGGENSPPDVDPGGPYSGAPGVPIDFDASGTIDADGDSMIYLWAFGDGSQPAFPSQIPTITHTYEEAGTYRASVFFI